jgi:HSP20 family protein
MAIKDLVPRFGRKGEHVPVRHGDYDPFRDFQVEMNRLFDDFFTGFPLAPVHEGHEHAMAVFSPRVDVAETDKEIKVSAELPGLDEKDVTVEMDDEAVTIRGERRAEQEEKGKNWFRREQTYGSFHRTVPLPAEVEGTKAKAVFKKGVLTVTAPKRVLKEARRKTIAIETD